MAARKGIDAATGLAAATSFSTSRRPEAPWAWTSPKANRCPTTCRTRLPLPWAGLPEGSRSDRLASFGDFIGLSRSVDVETAMIIKTEVSDGIIARGFEREALKVLKAKKGGKYAIFKIARIHADPVEERTVFGMTLRQKRDDLVGRGLLATWSPSARTCRRR